MVQLPEPKNRTAAAIFARHERDADDWRRPHLGASIIGSECMRHLWYSFRWASNPNFEGRILRLFERGKREEDWIVDGLRKIGMRVETTFQPIIDEHTTDKDRFYAGKQYRFKAIGGHFGGSIDGGVLGVLEAPKTWHLLEIKTKKVKLFKVLCKDGVAKAEPKHHAQIQSYMHGLKFKRALYICVCKDDDRIYTERIHYDRKQAEAILNVAETVIKSPEPLTKISEDPAWWECKFCDHRPICHLEQTQFLERNCRTCLSSTPIRTDGTWTCAHHQTILDEDAQRAGCESHLLIPTLLPWPVQDVNEEKRQIIYAKPDGSRIIDAECKLEKVTEQ